MAQFTAKVPDGQTWRSWISDGRSVHRRLIIGKPGMNGFVADGKFQSYGSAPAIPAKRSDNHDNRLVVRGGLAALTIDGSDEPAWVGHLGLARSGGLSLGIAHGTASFKDLEVRSLK